MAANINDKITSASSGVRPVNTTVSNIRNSGNTTLSCADLTGWPTASAVHFVTYKLAGTGNIVVGTQSDWKGIVSGSNITNLTLTGGSDNGNAIGDIVECLPTARFGKELYDALTVEHTQDGKHAITSGSTINSATITTPKIITSLNDTNDNELLKVTATTSAVNELTLTNAATGNTPSLSATGNDTNIGLNLSSKGTGEIQLNGAGMSGAWTSWTPTYTNMTIGNGTVTAAYKQIGKTVMFNWRITCGTTTAIGNNVTLTLPVSAATRYATPNLYSPIGGVVAVDIGTGVFWGLMTINNSTTVAEFDYSTGANLVGSFPFAEVSGDTVSCSGSYEAA
jgi:hypothetical protein